jgi:hypothetical protein
MQPHLSMTGQLHLSLRLALQSAKEKHCSNACCEKLRAAWRFDNTPCGVKKRWRCKAGCDGMTDGYWQESRCQWLARSSHGHAPKCTTELIMKGSNTHLKVSGLALSVWKTQWINSLPRYSVCKCSITNFHHRSHILNSCFTASRPNPYNPQHHL